MAGSISIWASAQQTSPHPVALTIYNQDFAVARTSVDLDLHPGINEVTTTRVTSQLEPDSVVLRDPTAKRAVHVMEQNYDAGVVSQEWMLEKYEGRTIAFQLGSNQIIQGKVIRAGAQQEQPLIEVNGLMQFSIPGTPLFPASTDGLLSKPTLRWQIQADRAEHYAAELAYVTGGLDWEATYNVVAPQSSDVTAGEPADVVGWVTIHNQSGSDFDQARIKLMAGDVAKIQSSIPLNGRVISGQTEAVSVQNPEVTQKTFDDFHLYDLNRIVTLRNGETKQVQFLDASDVRMLRAYTYDGVAPGLQPTYGGNTSIERGFGLDTLNTKVRIIEQIKNTESNRLGMPLPAGRVRFYRRDADGQMEFVGENTIGHTPAEDEVKIITGNAFDVKGSRRQTDFRINENARTLDETFEIKITNQKQQPIQVAVVEHMYRGNNWEITEKSAEYTKQDSQTLEFPAQVAAKGEANLTYSVRYTW
jgi:hypothetical protein